MIKLFIELQLKKDIIIECKGDEEELKVSNFYLLIITSFWQSCE